MTQWGVWCRLGNVEAAAHAVCFQVWLASSLLVDSLAVAAQALIGQNAGINPTQALVVAQRALTWGLRLGCTLALGLVVTRTYIPHLFSADAAMYGLAVQVLWWVALLQPVNALAFVWDGILYGVNGFKYASAVAFFDTSSPGAYTARCWGHSTRILSANCAMRVCETEMSAVAQVCCGDDAIQCGTCHFLHDSGRQATDFAAGAWLGVDRAGPGNDATGSYNLDTV